MGETPIEVALGDLRHQLPSRRADAVQALVRLAEGDDVPYDRILEALRARTRFGSPDREREREVSQRLHEARRVIGCERARRFGLRMQRPGPALSAISDRSLSRDATQLMWDAVDIYADRATLRSILDLATPGQTAAFATQWCESEVCNGGFAQFFNNSTGILAPEALAGFRLLNALDLAEPLARAMDLFPGGPPADGRARRVALEAISPDAFRLMDDAFFAAVDRGVVDTRIASYIRRHPAEFFSS